MPTVEVPNPLYEETEPAAKEPPSGSSELLAKVQAEGSFECVICLEALCDNDSGPVCVLTKSKSGNRVCRHFFHMHCAQRIKSVDGKGYGERVQTYFTDSVVKSCPNCRSEFDGVKEVPDPKMKPLEWYQVVEFSKGGLSKDEIIDCVCATLNIDLSILVSVLEEKWNEWDPNGEGLSKDTIELALRTIRKRMPRSDEPPFLPEDPIGWFDYWDIECEGKLTKAQVAKAVAYTLSSSEKEADELLENIWCLFEMDNPNAISRKQFLEPRGLSDTLSASLAEDPRFKARVETALASPKSRRHESHSPKSQLEVGMRVRILTEIGTPRYKWGRVRPGDIGTLKSIDKELCTCRVDFPRQRSWRGYLPELEKVPAYLDTYKPWQIGDEVQIIKDLARAKKQQDERSNWVSSMDATCGKLGKILLVLSAERKIKVQLARGTFVYVMENCVRPGMSDPQKFIVGMKVRVKPEVHTPKYQWGNVSPGDVGAVTAAHNVALTCQVSFPKHHNWKGYQPDMEIVEDASPPASPQNFSPPGSPRIRVGAYIRVKPSVTTPKFAWGRIHPGDIGTVTAVERSKELVTVDFPRQKNWVGYINEMEVVRVRPPTTSWSCAACTYLNEPASATCDICDSPPPQITDSDL